MEPEIEVKEAQANPEKAFPLSTLPIFVFRHARAYYLERQSVRETGRWNPDLDELKEIGKAEVLQSAIQVAEQIDPKKDIIILLSSPRARALRTKEIIEKCLREKNIEIMTLPSSTVEALRSGGDNSPITGKDNEVVNVDGSPYKPQDPNEINGEGLEKTSGERFRQFLSCFFGINKEALIKEIQQSPQYHGKRPVIIAVTHGEVLHAQHQPNEDYKTSFLGQCYPEYSPVKLSRGNAMKIEIDLEHPGDFILTMPQESTLAGKPQTRKLHFNNTNGSITVLG